MRSHFACCSLGEWILNKATIGGGGFLRKNGGGNGSQKNEGKLRIFKCPAPIFPIPPPHRFLTCPLLTALPFPSYPLLTPFHPILAPFSPPHPPVPPVFQGPGGDSVSVVARYFDT